MKTSYLNHSNRVVHFLVGVGNVVAQDPDADPDDGYGG